MENVKYNYRKSTSQMYEKSVGQISIITEQDMLGMSWLKPWQSLIEICRLENWDSEFSYFSLSKFDYNSHAKIQ